MVIVSWLDVVLVVMLIVSIAFGFTQGLLRQAVLLLAMYIATVLSAQYYPYLATMLGGPFHSEEAEITRAVAFVVLAVALTLPLTWLLWAAYRQTKLPDVVMLDSLGGAALGGIIGVFSISLTLVLLRYSMAVPLPEDSPIVYYLHMGLSKSYLQEAFHSSMPLIHATLRPWLPQGIPMVLSS